MLRGEKLTPAELANIPSTVLELSTRSANVLENNHIRNLHELISTQKRVLLMKPNFGWKSLREIETALVPYGVTFPDEEDQ